MKQVQHVVQIYLNILLDTKATCFWLKIKNKHSYIDDVWLTQY